MSEPLLVVEGLTKRFPVRAGLFARRHWRTVVEDISFTLASGETRALVGASGSGKTTVARLILGLEAPDAGVIRLGGQLLPGKTAAERLALRRQLQVVFQDPFSSLNPRHSVEAILTEGMRVHGLHGSAVGRRQEATRLLDSVGLPSSALVRYPHEFSGGQRQRIGIARALSVGPSVVILDEPTSALDVSVQGQILNLLRQLQSERGLGYLLITHDRAIVDYLADSVSVLEKGHLLL